MNLSFVLDVLLAQPFVWQSTLWLVLGLGVARRFASDPARAHAVLLAALAGAIVSPTASVCVGRFGWCLFPRRVVTIDIDGTAATSGTLGMWTHGVGTVLLVASGLMIGICLVSFVRSFLSARRLLRSCTRATDLDAKRALAIAKQRSSQDYGVELLECEDIGSPSIWCWSNPAVILVPRRFSSCLSVECLASILNHELAHLTRRDHINNVLADLLVATVGWNPLAWYLRSRLRQTAERACDNAAGSSRRARADYAEALLQLASNVRPKVGLAIVPRYGALGARIRMILEGHDSRLTIDHGFLGLVCACALASLALLASVQRAQGTEYRFKHGLDVATFPHFAPSESNEQISDLLRRFWEDRGTEMVLLDNDSGRRALGASPADPTPLLDRGIQVSDGGAIFIRAKNDRPLAQNMTNFFPSSERPRWIGKD